MKTKKKYIILIAICGIAAFFLLNSDLRFLIWSSSNIFNHPQRTYVEDFDGYKKDFQILADCMKGLENEIRGEEHHSVLVMYDKDGVYLLNSNKSSRIVLNDKEKESLLRIFEAFGHGEFHVIFFDANRISFVTEDDFAVVYSFDDKKPDYVRSKEKEPNYYYYVQKLQDNWYSITGTSKDGMPF